MRKAISTHEENAIQRAKKANSKEMLLDTSLVVRIWCEKTKRNIDVMLLKERGSKKSTYRIEAGIVNYCI